MNRKQRRAQNVQKKTSPLAIADKLYYEATHLYQQGCYAEAEVRYRRSLEILEKQLGPEHHDVAANLNNLAVLLKILGNYTEAERLCRRSLGIYEKQLGSEHPHVAGSLNNLAALLDSLGNYTEAERLCRRSLEIREKQLGPEHPDVAVSLNNLAGLLKTLGKYAEAELLYRRSLKILEKQLGAEHPDVASNLNNLGGLLYTLGSYAEVETLYRRSLEIREKQLGLEHPDVAVSLNNLAGLLKTLGKYAEAELLYRRSIEIREKQLGPEHHAVANILNNLAGLLYAHGNYAEAESLYRRSLEINEKRLGPEHPDVAASFSSLAILLDTLGNYTEAEPLYRRSLEIREKQLGLEHPDVASSLNNLAGLLYAIGNYAEAEPLYRRSLGIREKQLGLDHPDVAGTINNLAVLLCDLGKYAEAEQLYRRSLEISKKQLGPGHPDVASCLHNLAILLIAIQLTSAAILLAKRAVNIMQKVRQNVSSIGFEQLSTFDKSIELYYFMLSSLLIESGRYGEAEYVMGMQKDKERFELLRRDRNIDMLVRNIAYNEAEAPLIERFDTLGASLYALGQRQEALKKIKEPTPEQKQELADVKQRLEEVNREFNQFLDSLHNALPSREVSQVQQDAYRLIDLSEASPGTAAITTVTAEDSFHTILATPFGCTTFSAEHRAEDIAKKVMQLRDLLKGIDNNDYLSIARELYDIIIRPMEQEFNSGNITTLYWMLNGALRLLPLAALHDGEQFLLEKYRNINITTISKIGTMPHEQWNGLGMGVTKEYAGHQALTSVKEELENIIASEDTNGVIPGDILLDEQFTREAMEQKLETRYKAVHIASHFELNPVNETLSYLLLGDGSKIRMDELSCKPRMFKGVDLVAFSACSTGLGTTSTRGREVDGIGYLGEMQGAKTVLATLWPVEDKSTSMLMREFYRLREEGMTKAEALRQAQLALLQGKLISPDGHDFTHPYFWAPFILIGNGG